MAWTTIVIPTRDSAGWIGVLLEHYQTRGFTPTLLLDSRTSDDTAVIAARAGAPVVKIDGFTFTEAIVSVTRNCVATPWALFMHDDEVPSDQLFARLAGAPPPREAESVAISRRWAWYEPGQQLRYGRSDHWEDRAGQNGADHMWRLFRPDRVTFIARMHTDGFLVDRWARLPLDAYFVHFEWVIRNHAQRAAKLRAYDKYRHGYGRFFEKMYLPESQGAGVIEYLPFGTDDFNRLAVAYYAARKTASAERGKGMGDYAAEIARRLREWLRPTNFAQEAADRVGLTPRLDREVVDEDWEGRLNAKLTHPTHATRGIL